MAANAAVSEKTGHACALPPNYKAAHHAPRIQVDEPLIHLQQCLLSPGNLLLQSSQNVIHQARTFQSIVQLF